MEELIKLLEIKQQSLKDEYDIRSRVSGGYQSIKDYFNGKQQDFLNELDQAIEEAKKRDNELQMYKDKICDLHSELLELESRASSQDEEIADLVKENMDLKTTLELLEKGKWE